MKPANPFPFIIDKPRMAEISDDDDIQSSLTNGDRSYFAMDEAFCARMRAAIEAGLESAPPRLEPKIPNTFQQSLGRSSPRSAIWSMLKGPTR
jgi:hypothetical protein